MIGQELFDAIVAGTVGMAARVAHAVRADTATFGWRFWCNELPFGFGFGILGDATARMVHFEGNVRIGMIVLFGFVGPKLLEMYLPQVLDLLVEKLRNWNPFGRN